MSGIAAIYGPGAGDKLHLVEEMLSRMEHRGPDVKWTFARKHVALGLRARQTEKPGRQPTASAGHATVVVADAEICDKQAPPPGSSPGEAGRMSNAEAIARAYERFGAACPRKLDGVFSFVVSGNDRLLAARDPLGGLPLYWGKADGRLAFASELKALVGITENIEEFPPGHYFDSGSGLSAYFSLPSAPATEKDAEAAAKNLRELLDAAVQRRIQAGVSTGVLLSGGLDSSIIAAIAKRHCAGLIAFTAGTKSAEDLPFARQVAEHLDMEHEEYEYDIDDMFEVLPKVIYHLESFDAPLVRSAVPNYLVSRLAGLKVDVVLIGEGGDENFGGYSHLKRLDSAKKQHEASLRLFGGLHNNGFMRTDRMNAAHSLTATAPFFDREVVEFALGLHPSLKIRGEKKIEKWILRKAFEDHLPQDVVWRPKQQFARGCGSEGLLGDHARMAISDGTLEARRVECPSANIRSKEELLYFDIFREHFGDAPSIIGTVGQWHE